MTPPTALCPACHRSVFLNRGRLMGHYLPDSAQQCPGTGLDATPPPPPRDPSKDLLTVAERSDYRATATGTGAMSFYFKPTRLGTYMVQDRGGALLTAGDGASVVRRAVPGPSAEWAASQTGKGVFTMRSTACRSFRPAPRMTCGMW